MRQAYADADKHKEADMHIETVFPAYGSNQQAARAVAAKPPVADDQAKYSGRVGQPVHEMPKLGPVTGGQLAELLSPEAVKEINATRAGELKYLSPAVEDEVRELLHSGNFSGSSGGPMQWDKDGQFIGIRIEYVVTKEEGDRLREKKKQMYLDGTFPVSDETKKWLAVLDKLESGVYVEISAADMEKFKEAFHENRVGYLRARIVPPMGGSEAEYRKIVKTVQRLDRGEDLGLSEEQMQRMKAYMLAFEARGQGPAERAEIAFLDESDNFPPEIREDIFQSAEKLHPARLHWLSHLVNVPDGAEARKAAEDLGTLKAGVVYMNGVSPEDVARLKELASSLSARRHAAYKAAAAQGLSGLEIYKKILESDLSQDKYGAASDRALGEEPGSWMKSRQAAYDFLSAHSRLREWRKDMFSPEGMKKRHNDMKARIEAGLTPASMTVG